MWARFPQDAALIPSPTCLSQLRPSFHAHYFCHAEVLDISWKCSIVLHIPAFERDQSLLPALPHLFWACWILLNVHSADIYQAPVCKVQGMRLCWSFWMHHALGEQPQSGCAPEEAGGKQGLPWLRAQQPEQQSGPQRACGYTYTKRRNKKNR